MELIILNDGLYQLVPVTKEILEGIEILSEATCFDVCDILRLKLTGYVDNKATGKVNVVRFGDPNLSIKRNNPVRQRMFFARFRPILAKVRGQKSLSPAFWSIRAWRKGSKL